MRGVYQVSLGLGFVSRPCDILFLLTRGNGCAMSRLAYMYTYQPGTLDEALAPNYHD